MDNEEKSAFLLKIQRQIAKLIREERWKSGLMPDSLDENLGFSRGSVLSWERGKVSPPANLYYKLMSHLGSESFRKAAELDLELQLERTQLMGSARLNQLWRTA